jgi:hypothetical protein
MGLVRLLVVVMIAAAQAGCASTFVPDLVAAPAAPPPLADLVAAPAPPPRPPISTASCTHAARP